MSKLLSKADAKCIETLQRNCYEVLNKPCKHCSKKACPEDAFQWLLVARVTEEGGLDTGEVNIVHAKNLRSSKSLTFSLGKDGGKKRVRLPAYLHVSSLRY
jgi:hypothetical protein